MIALPDEELLRVWDAARSAPAALRPALLLETLAGDSEAAGMAVGARDRGLLDLRKQLGGGVLEGVVTCPACGTKLELTFDTPPASDADPMSPLSIGELLIEFRLPDSRDLVAIAGEASIDDARLRLAKRCVVSATCDGVDVAMPPLDDELLAALSDAMSRSDPDGDLRMDVSCPDCAHAWEVLFDPATYVWRELDAAAIAAMREIDALASAYGWSEQQILSIPRSRRAIYLGMVLG
jgi:ribosomal protein S27E